MRLRGYQPLLAGIVAENMDVSALSPIIRTTGTLRLEVGATVYDSVVGCSLAVCEEMLSCDEGIKYWANTAPNSVSTSSVQESLPDAIVNARLLGVAPKEAIGRTVILTVMGAQPGVVATKSCRVRIRGVFDCGVMLSSVGIYVPYVDLGKVMCIDPETCDEVWIWSGKSTVLGHSRERIYAALASRLRRKEHLGGICVSELRVVDVCARYPKDIVTLVKEVREARKVVEELGK